MMTVHTAMGNAKRRSIGRNLAGRRGFTLLELLVSLTILSAMAAMLFGSFRMSAKAWTRGEQAADGVQRFRIMADLMRRQVSCAYALDVRQGNTGESDQVEDVQTRQQLQSRGVLRTVGAMAMTGAPFFKGSPTGLKFTGLYPLRPHQNAGMLLITYSVEGASDGTGYMVVEQESRYLGSDFLRMESLFLGGQQVQTEMVFEKLESAQFQYYGVDPLTGMAQWEDSWDSEAKDSLPKAVALELVLREEIGRMGTKHRFLMPIIADSFRSRTREGVRALMQQNQPQP